MCTPQHLNEALLLTCNTYHEQLQDERRRTRELEEQNLQLKRLLTACPTVQPEDFNSRTPERHNSAPMLTPAPAAIENTPTIGGGYCLPDLLKQLDQEDESCIFIVRKIHKLRFQSASILEHYFSGFGEVKKVLLLPWRRQKSVGPHPGKARPASMGFIVMKSAIAVSNILSISQHTIAGWPISVQVFERQSEKCGDSRRSSITSDFLSYEWSSPASTAATPAVDNQLAPLMIDPTGHDYSPALFAAESVLKGLTDDLMLGLDGTTNCSEFVTNPTDVPSIFSIPFISQPVNPDYLMPREL
ncbi:hypothetical protein FOL47_007078 [Perkinsus chesapeaki]|uniref:Uncharacterized protein n=1 Tax=Perkinsus chesapeaki TaxID=330153 RepID=A0A7J6LMX8_PERCH|nr:hypothetical protein FOL47_007078 [Perkinsus chesapeaki]